MSFTVGLALGAALLAAWVDGRSGERRPATVTRVFVHAVIACALLQVASYAVDRLLSGDGGFGQQLAAVFGLLLPALVYAFASGFWIARLLAQLTVARR